MNSKPIDYSPLTTAISPDDIRQYRAESHSSPSFYERYFVYNKFIFWFVLLLLVECIGIGILVIVTIATIDYYNNSYQTNGLDSATYVVYLIGIVMTIAPAYFLIYRRVKKSRRATRDAIHLERFAAQNNLIYETEVFPKNINGIIFSIGSQSKIINRLVSQQDGYEISNYHYYIQEGRSRRIRQWGYIRIDLKRSVPEMVLVAKNSRFGMSSDELAYEFSRDQVLSLEGDFNSHFTLYAPKQYEEDALYIFTPDLMALLIDDVVSYDVEVIDNYLYIYSPKLFDLADSTLLNRLYNIITIVGSRVIDRTRLYTDSNVVNTVSGTTPSVSVRLKKNNLVFIWSFVIFFIGMIWVVIHYFSTLQH